MSMTKFQVIENHADIFFLKSRRLKEKYFKKYYGYQIKMSKKRNTINPDISI